MSDRQINQLIALVASHTSMSRTLLKRGARVDAARFATRAALSLEALRAARISQAVLLMGRRRGVFPDERAVAVPKRFPSVLVPRDAGVLAA